MHRSGTSAVTRVINILGAHISRDLIPPDVGNELGHWEPATLVRLHDDMLRSAQSYVSSAFGVDPSWFASPDAAMFQGLIADYIQGQFPTSSLFVLKDPRMSLFIPLWRRTMSELEIDIRVVLPFRDPHEVATSLGRRQKRLFTDSLWPDGRGALIWLRHVLAAEHATRGLPRSFVPFDAFLGDWQSEVKRLSSQAGLALPPPEPALQDEIGAFLSREHKHENAAADAAVERYPSSWYGRVFEQLKRCAAEPNAGAEIFDAARLTLGEASHLFREYVIFLEERVDLMSSLRQQLADSRAAQADLEAALLRTADDRERLRSVLESTSWRATAPIRNLKRRLTSIVDRRSGR